MATVDPNLLATGVTLGAKEYAHQDESNLPGVRTESAQIQRAILKTLIYADLFDSPLTFDEIVRYLPVPADGETIRRLLEIGSADGSITRVNDFFTLPGRTELVDLRVRRQAIARAKWSRARRPILWIARLPFVRMVAVTGSLAVNNVEEQDDVDLFIVTAAQRLWLCRAFVILVVRVAARAGVVICPNYFLAESQLTLDQQGFFDARELTQMVPLYGAEVYGQIRSRNRWVEAYLPQASGTPNSHAGWIELSPAEVSTKRVMERLLGTRLGAWLESWEMGRKVRRFNRRAQNEGGRVRFTPECCKGHFDGHGERIPRQYAQRLARYGFAKEEGNV